MIWRALAIGSLLALVSARPCFAAIAHVQTTKQWATNATCANTAAASVSETFTSTPSTGNLVTVYISWSESGVGDHLSTVTDNQTGNTYTIDAARPSPNNNAHAALAYSILVGSSGTFTITANFTSNFASACIGISEWSGNVASTPEDGHNSGTGASATEASGSVTPTQSADLYLSVTSDDDGAQTCAVPTSWSLRAQNHANGTAGQTIQSASFISTDAAAVSASWTGCVSANWAANIVAFKAAAGGGATVVPLRTLIGVGQ